MDVNVKGLEPDVVARLAEQAAAEGMSQQEWIRQALRRTAARLSPAELADRHSAATPMTNQEFSVVRKKAAARRRATVEELRASERRR
jgi:hypothetical protein